MKFSIYQRFLLVGPHLIDWVRAFCLGQAWLCHTPSTHAANMPITSTVLIHGHARAQMRVMREEPFSLQSHTRTHLGFVCSRKACLDDPCAVVDHDRLIQHCGHLLSLSPQLCVPLRCRWARRRKKCRVSLVHTLDSSWFSQSRNSRICIAHHHTSVQYRNGDGGDASHDVRCPALCYLEVRGVVLCTEPPWCLLRRVVPPHVQTLTLFAALISVDCGVW